MVQRRSPWTFRLSLRSEDAIYTPLLTLPTSYFLEIETTVGPVRQDFGCWRKTPAP